MKQRWMALAAAAALSACNPQAPKNAAPQGSPSPSASAPLALNITGSGTDKQPVRFLGQKGNSKQYEIDARSFTSKGAPGTAKATFMSPHVTFYGKDGSKLVADSQRAVVDQSTNIVELLGKVTAHNGTGMTLQCDTLRYDRGTEMFHGNGHVVITESNGFHATGNRVDSDITLTHTQMQ